MKHAEAGHMSVPGPKLAVSETWLSFEPEKIDVSLRRRTAQLEPGQVSATRRGQRAGSRRILRTQRLGVADEGLLEVVILRSG